jgi:hypothetical protein
MNSWLSDYNSAANSHRSLTVVLANGGFRARATGSHDSVLHTKLARHIMHSQLAPLRAITATASSLMRFGNVTQGTVCMKSGQECVKRHKHVRGNCKL